MTYDLRREPWIPWLRRSGAVEWGPPAALVSRMVGADADPVVAIAAPRPDFEGAMQEFLIGLLTAALLPEDEDAWRALWEEPPDVAALQHALDSLPDAFNLDGDGPRFFQDFSAADFAEIDAQPVDALLIDSPGDQTQKLNKDLFVKRGRVERMSRAAAVMALVTVQTYSPAGGQGYRTSMRGGGPLTTLVDPHGDRRASPADERPLWELLWANVETLEQIAARSPADAPSALEASFPWLAPTRTSNPKAAGRSTTPSDAGALQVYFGMPRRIRLEFGAPGVCDITGIHDDQMVTGLQTTNYGIQYVGWKHPLSPHRRQKLTEPWLPVHGQPSGVGWRDWLSLTLTDPSDDGFREPAASVSHFLVRRARTIRRLEPQVNVFGFDMDNMKARGWVSATLPAFAIDDAEHRRLVYSTAAALVEATSVASSALLFSVKAALFANPDEAGGDLNAVKHDLWDATELGFYDIVESLARLDPVSTDSEAATRRATDVRHAFLGVLERACLDVFDRWCPAVGLDVDALQRRVAARYQLSSALRGYGKLGTTVFTVLGVALPEGSRKPRVSRAAPTSHSSRESRT